MTIDIFEGFTQPGGEVRVLADGSNQMGAILTSAYAHANQGIYSGAGKLTFRSVGSDAHAYRINLNRKIPLTGRNRAVFGVRVSGDFSSLNFGYLMLGLGIKGNSGTDPGLTNTNAVTIASFLPCLQLGSASNAIYNVGIGLRQSGTLPTHNVSLGVGNINSLNVREPLTGQDWTKETMIELVHDFAANVCEVWVDNVKMISYPFTYTEAMKTQEVLPIIGAVIQRTTNSPANGLSVHCAYVGDERLGRVKVINRPLTSDFKVDRPPYDEGDAFSKVSTDINPAAPLTAESSGKVLFASSANVSGNVLAVGLSARVKSTHRSAMESVAELTFDVAHNGQEKAVGSAKPLTVDYQYLRTTMRTNPLTNENWTDDDVNALATGFSLEIKDRFPAI